MGRNLIGARSADYARQQRTNSKCPILVFDRKKTLRYPIDMASIGKVTLPEFKNGWREFGGKRTYFRSRWEANYGRYLQWLVEQRQISSWEHEPKTFWFPIKRGCVSYLPDFKVTNLDGSFYWVEVKGYYDPKSLTKIRRFRKYFPDEKLTVIDKVWYSRAGKKISGLIPGWEGKTTKVFYVKKIS